MTDALDDLPPPEENLPAPPDSDAGTWDIMGAAWRAETIRTDAWNYAQDKRRDLSRSMYDMLQPEARMRIQAKRWDYENNWTDFEDLVLDEVAREVPTNPTKYGTLPLSREQFDQRIDAERRQELDEAQAILDQPGGGFAEFLGAGARAMTDQTSLLLLPFGVSSGFFRSVGTEALLGAAGEAAVLPREFEVAKELDLPTPDATSRILLGAALGGGLAAGLHGLVKGAGMVLARRNALRDAKPADMDDLDFEAAVDGAEAQLRGDPTVQETIGPTRDSRIDTAAGPLDFDYRSGGNASPRTNRVGYVFGRFTEMGYPPHVAAALVGNLMQESGPAINTRAVGDNGNAFGMGQWNGPRRMAYLAYARKRGVDPGDLDTQIAWLDLEMRTTERAARDRIMATSNARQAAAVASEAFWRPGVPHTERRMAYADAVMRQFDNGNVPKWDGAAVVVDGPTEFTGYSTSRGYTGAGQITAGDEFRIDVDYEVMDLSLLRRATGAFQPRDRSRVASDAWIADTAARLDPAQLMPSPTADRGTPIVGPDGMIESGNGRAAAIGRAYEQHPERAAAYRAQIEAAGYAIPEGMERPVLIARRKTDLADDELQRFTVAAQDSGVAAMTPTEVARASSQAMTAPVLQRLQPGQPLNAVENGDFVKAALAGLPRSARNAMFGEGGILNSEGVRRLREALFARAWPDPDIIARFAETDAGPLKSLLEALDRAAPAWAALRAEIEAGRVRPEMDISGYVLDAMRLIGAARDLAGREGLSIARAVDELLNEVDLLEGAVSPLTTALVRRFWRDGRAAPADQGASFLTRYADDARKAGVTGALFDGPTPRDVLQAIDPEGFADLPEDLGTPRGFARPAPREAVPVAEEGYNSGAASPEAVEADAETAAALVAGPSAPVTSAPKPDPNNPKLIDTRGQGVRYHGATSPIDKLQDDYVGSDKNIYGQGFYTSDAVSITDGYSRAKGSKTGVIYRVEETGPINALDMEQPVPDWLRSDLEKDTDGITGDLIEEALDENPANLREFYDAVRTLSPQYDLPTYEVQDIFDGFSRTILRNGYNALDHIGGLASKKQPHAVRIYLQAQSTVAIRPVDLDQVKVKSSSAADTAISASPAPAVNRPAPADPLAEVRAAVEDGFAGFQIDMPDGTSRSVAEVLDDLQGDTGFDAFIQACAITGGAQ